VDTTCREFAEYLGVDLTDGYAVARRPVDVCGLDRQGPPKERRLQARFWQWTYGAGGPTNVTALLPEIRAARGTVMDGPQALASRGTSMRVAERQVGAPGHTPSSLAGLTGPFAGFVRTSVEMFSTLDQAGISVGGLTGPATVAEHYPGGVWRYLAPGIPPKKTVAGLAARKTLLETLGVSFPAIRLTDDHLDACLGALIAAASDGEVPGAFIARAGGAQVRDHHVLREGEILMLAVDEATMERMAQAMRTALKASAPLGAGSNTRLVRVVITESMSAKVTPAIAVAGLSDLGATRANKLRIATPGLGGHLWLGDHSMFWESHQTDRAAKQVYQRLRTLLASPGREEDLEVVIGD
jgi:hypothetical protein